MKALAIDAVGHSRMVELAAPAAPGIGEVEVRITQIGICGSDLNTFKGMNPLVSLPRVPGHEISGVITALGPQVDGLALGQRVTVLPYTSCGTCSSCRRGRVNACRTNKTLGVQQDGALTERIVVGATKILANARLAPRHLALVEPLSVGFHAVARGRVAAGDRVLVLGCGMIGVGALLGARRMGAEVTVSDLSAFKRGLAQELGATNVIDPAAGDMAARVAELTDGEGYDVVIEAVGIPETFIQAVDHAAFSGRVVYIGYCKAPVTFARTQLFNLKELDILGSRNATEADFLAAMEWLETMGPRADLLVSKVFPFAQAAEALPYFDDNRDTVLKVMVEQ